MKKSKLLTELVAVPLLVAATSLSAQSIALTPTDDATVEQDNPNSNFGSDPIIDLRDDAPNAKSGYVKFDATGLPQITDIESFVISSNPSINRFATFYILAGGDSNSWDEGTITWNNAPGLNTTFGTSDPDGGLAEFNLDSTGQTATEFYNVALADEENPITATLDGVGGNDTGGTVFAGSEALILDALNNGDRTLTIVAIHASSSFSNFHSKEFDTSSLAGSSVPTLNVTLVPEPATYAAIFGWLALGLALWRRRLRRG